jgi:lysophospholipid hydrolase
MGEATAESSITSLMNANITLSNISNILTSATSHIQDIPSSSSPGIFGWMLSLIASLILGVTRIFVWVLSFATITIPTLIFKILSVSFTLTLNFSSLYMNTLDSSDDRSFLTFIILAVAYSILRYRYLTEYSRLPPEPQRKEPQIDLFPDSQEGDAKPGLQNYLDEVLTLF